MVGVGLISYSLYLWHWPLLVLARIYLQRPLSPVETAVLVALGFGLAVLTWRFVERPFRRPPPSSRKRDLALALSPLLVLVAAGALFFVGKGLPMRLAPAARAAAAFNDFNPARERCFANGGPVPSGCRFGTRQDARDYDVLVWGDSHADAVTPGVIAWAQKRGWSVREATRGGCPPLVDILNVAPKRGPLPGCRASAPVLMKEIADNPALKLIVLSARWPMYAEPVVVYDPDSPSIRLQDARSTSQRPYPLSQALDRTLTEIAATGTHARVVVMGPVPELTFNPDDCIAEALHLGRKPWACWDAPARLPLIRARGAETQIAAALARHPGVAVAWPFKHLCTETSCVAVLRRSLLYADDDHLSATGARMLVPPGWTRPWTPSLPKARAFRPRIIEPAGLSALPHPAARLLPGASVVGEIGMLGRVLGAVLAVTAGLGVANTASAADLRPDQVRFREIYKELVETNTSLSVGSCTEAAAKMGARLKAAGFTDSQLTYFSVPEHPKDGGLVAILPGTSKTAKPMLLLGHLDVVEAKRADWVLDPFVLTERDGHFYGRGTLDMKNGAASWVSALLRM